MEYVFDQLVLT